MNRKRIACVLALLAGSGVFAASPVAGFGALSNGKVQGERQAGGFSADVWFARRDNASAEAARLRHEYTKCLEAVNAPAENVTVPVESYPDGSVKASIFAEKAQFFIENGKVWGEGVVIRQFSRDGQVEAEVKARNCVVDRMTRNGWAEGRCSVTHGGTMVEGDGIYFSLADEYLMISENTRIITTDLKLGGLKL